MSDFMPHFPAEWDDEGITASIVVPGRYTIHVFRVLGYRFWYGVVEITDTHEVAHQTARYLEQREALHYARQWCGENP